MKVAILITEWDIKYVTKINKDTLAYIYHKGHIGLIILISNVQLLLHCPVFQLFKSFSIMLLHRAITHCSETHS